MGAVLRKTKPYKVGFAGLDEAKPASELVTTPLFQIHLPRGFRYRRYEIEVSGLPEPLSGLRILHLTDTHLKPRWGRPYDALLERLAASPPDLILFTGDFIDDKCDHRPTLPVMQRFVRGLVAAAPTYAILGNHDPDILQPYVAELGVTFVSHRRMVVPIRGGWVELIGFPGTMRHQLDRAFLHALPPREVGLPRIILSHYPDLFPAAFPLDPDLYLAGHTHGGQICLPTGEPIVTHDRMPKRFAKGLHQIGHTWYHVSHGFGFTGLPFRVFCPAEAVELVMKSET